MEELIKKLTEENQRLQKKIKKRIKNIGRNMKKLGKSTKEQDNEGEEEEKEEEEDEEEEEEDEDVNDEKDDDGKIERMKRKILENQKNLRQLKKYSENSKNKQINDILENMCIYGYIAKKEIKKEKKEHPERFIETSQALKFESKDENLFALGLISQNLENLGIETAIEAYESLDTQEEDLTNLQFIFNGMIDKKKI